MEICIRESPEIHLKYSDIKDGLTRLGYKYDRLLSCGYVKGKQTRGGWKGFQFRSQDNPLSGECVVDI